MIEAVVFDLWDTIGTKNIPVAEALRRRFDLPRTYHYARNYEQALQLRAWSSYTEAAEHYLRHFDLAPTVAHVAFVVDTLRYAVDHASMFDGMAEVLRSVSHRVNLGLLSNTTSFECQVLERWGIDTLFDAKVFSWEIGSLKPDRKNFEQVCARLNVSAPGALYVDDTMRNVASARECGLGGYRFRGVPALSSWLWQRGLM